MPTDATPDAKGLTVSVESSPGEPSDKVTILEIEAAHIGDEKSYSDW